MPMILIKKGAKARKLEPQPLRDEMLLQRYIVENPECLPMEEIEEDLRLLVVAREFPAGSGSIDVLALDQEGAVYVIETKLYRNADKRRVLAQALDYGAGLWWAYRSGADFLAKLEENAQRTIKRGVREEIQAIFELSSEETNRLLNQAAENVAAGRIRFVVLMDRIDDDLKALIAFVNANSEFAVYGVELEFYDLEGDATLVTPRLYGAETAKKGRSKTVETVRDEAFFEQASSTLDPEVVSAMSDLYEFSVREADTVKWGRGATGSFNPKFHAVDPKSVYTVYSDGRLYLNFKWLRGTEAGRAAVDAIGKGLKVMGFHLPADFRERFVKLDARWWVPRLEELKGLLRSVVAAARK